MNDTSTPARDSVFRILIVEDYPILAELLADQLSGMKEYSVVGVASVAETALALVASTRPDLLLLDLGIPARTDGLRVLREARALLPDLRVLVFSAVGNMANVHQCVKLGADGFVEKTASWGELLQALRKVRAGEPYLCEAVSSRLVEAVRRESAGELLDDREAEVLRRLGKGEAIKAIAQDFAIGASMVYKTLNGLRAKLRARSNEDLLHRAYLFGFLEPPPPQALLHAKIPHPKAHAALLAKVAQAGALSWKKAGSSRSMAD
jgi:DNA-binding NarL/FixJ family response regulator